MDRVSRWISKKIVNIISVKAAKIFLFFFPSPMQACNVLLQLNISSSAMLSWSVVRGMPNSSSKLAIRVLFWMKIYTKNIVNLLWAGKNTHLQCLASAPVAGNGCFLLASYNDWPRW